VDFTGYLFWGGLVLALAAGGLLAASLMSKVVGLLKSARRGKSLFIGASMLGGVIILSAGLVAAIPFLPYVPPSQKEPDRVHPNWASREGTPPFGRWDETHTPPKIGKLELKQEYWEYIKEAAQRYHISPYLIQAVCAIESRYDPNAKSGRGSCIGLMQLHKDTARKYGVDPYNPRENIMGGTAVLADLVARYNGDIHSVLHKYNAACTPAYEREVIKAYNQAKQFEMVSLPPPKSKN
jgi:soluble lytic murein transglycosylase-like protein